jgi:hypothetical protein
VKNIFDSLEVKIDKLKQIYTEFIKTNQNEIFIFGLDTFHFQTKLIDIEYFDMKRLFLAINNRMYCEYFKLHKIIVEYIHKNFNDKKNSNMIKANNYPIYKDLEPFKEYDFELILDIHENIMNLIGVIMSILNNKENELVIYRTKQNIGLNIDNFIATFNFNNSVMREKIQMFATYVEFFHKMHTKYLKRFCNKIQLMYTNINNDIKFDDSVEISKNKKKELIDEFTTGNIDKELLKDLKTSIGSETNSEEDSCNSKTPVSTPRQIDPPNTALNRKSYKDIFKKKVNKVSNMLKLFKSKEKKDSSVSLYIDDYYDSDHLDDFFSGINKSCDSIIYRENEVIGLELTKSNDEPVGAINAGESGGIIIDIEEPAVLLSEMPTPIPDITIAAEKKEQVETPLDVPLDKTLDKTLDTQEPVEEQSIAVCETKDTDVHPKPKRRYKRKS